MPKYPFEMSPTAIPPVSTNVPRLLTLALLCCLLLAGCGREEIAADVEPPPQVQFTLRSAETDLAEQGIDAVPDGHYIYLSWLPSPAGDLAGYRLYRQAEDSLEQELIDELEPSATEYEDRDSVLAPSSGTGLSQGFYYWITAFDQSGNESPLSEEAYYKLIPKADLSEPLIQESSLVLSWSYSQMQSASYFVVRLFRWVGNAWEPFWLQEHEEFFPLQVSYDQPLASGVYRYQVDVVGSSPEKLPSGSEKALQFVIP